jgi:hypothetical protein
MAPTTSGATKASGVTERVPAHTGFRWAWAWTNSGRIRQLVGSPAWPRAVATVHIIHPDAASLPVLRSAARKAHRAMRRSLSVSARTRILAEWRDLPGPTCRSSFLLELNCADAERVRPAAARRFAQTFVDALGRKGFKATLQA